MSGFMQDIRFAIRMLRRAPGFTAIAIATLAIGIGATTIMFAVVDAVLIRPLPYPHADRVVHLTEAFEHRPGMSIAYANFLDWERMNRVFASMGAIRPHALTLSGMGEAEQLDGRQVSGDFFRTLGVTPELGRDFNAADDQPSATATVILSHKFWSEHFGADRGVIGRAITLDGEPYIVIGILPRTFSYNDEVPDAFVPIGLIKDKQFWQDRFAHDGTYAVGRLKAGVTAEAARQDMDRVAETLQQLYPETNKKNWVSVVPLREWLVGGVRKPLLILLAAVGLLLLIACANIANLLLAKGTARARELAVRLAVGASRARLLRQLLTESVLLGVAGGVAGILLAIWGAGALVSASPDALPRVGEVRIDGAVLAFTFGVAVLTGILFGIAPALQTPAGAQLAMKEGERGSTAAGHRRISSGLIAGQIALSLALLVCAGLLIRSFQRVMQVDAGFDSHQLVTASVIMSATKYKSVVQTEGFYSEALRNIRAIPGVTGASAVMPLPMSGNEWDTDYLLDGAQGDIKRQLPDTEIGWFGPGYLATMQIPLIAGRDFTDSDTENSLPVALVNQEFVRRNFPNENPIGHRIRLGSPAELANAETPQSRWQTIVGVVGDVKQYGLDRHTVPTVYTPFAQSGLPVLRRDFVIRTGVRDALSVTPQIRNAIATVDPGQALADFSTMEHLLASRLATRTLSMALLGSFAAIALVLGAIGIYGVVSYWVVQRTREIGVRMALGAWRSEVLRLILSRALRLLAIGAAAGLIASIGAAQLLKSMLYGVGAYDPRVLLVVITILTAVATLASYIPARRAASVDPVIALRQE